MKSRNPSPFSRRRMVQGLGATLLAPVSTRGADAELRIAGKAVEIQLTAVSPQTFRLTVQPIQDGRLGEIPDDGTLLHTTFGAPAAKWRGAQQARTVKLADLRVMFAPGSAGVPHRDGQRRNGPARPDRPRDGRDFLHHRHRTDSRAGRRRPAVRPPRQHGSHDERFRRLQPAHVRQPRADSMADRHGRLGILHSSAVRLVRFHKRREQVPGRAAVRSGWRTRRAATAPTGRHLDVRAAHRPVRSGIEGSGSDPVRMGAPHRAARTAPPVELRLPAVAPHAGGPGSHSPGGENLPRKETAMRRHDLPGNGLLSGGMEYQQHRVHVQPEGDAGSEGDV